MTYILPKRIIINNARDLDICAQYTSQMNLSPSTSSEIHENYSICLLMLALYKARNFVYPTVIEILGHNDPPDFIIHVSTPPVLIGIEHTTATLGSFKVALKEMEQNCDIRWLESSLYIFKKALPVKRARSGLISNDNGLTQPPLYGNAHLKNWVDFVFAAYKIKSQRSSKPDKNQFDSYELLVEVSIPNLIGDKHDEALILLKDKVKKESKNIPAIYHKLHIISQGCIIIDAIGNSEIIKLSKKDVKILCKKLRIA